MRKKYYKFFNFPLLSKLSEPTQCTAPLRHWVLCHSTKLDLLGASPGSKIALGSSLWSDQYHHLIMPSLSVGGTTTCCTGTTEGATHGCQELLLLILLPWYCQLPLKRSFRFFQMYSRISEQQGCYRYLGYSFLI